MTWLTPMLLFVVAWLAVFLQTQLAPIRALLGVPPGILPALVVYAAFTHRLGIVSTLTIGGGLAVDALSAGRLGAGIAPLFALGFILHTRQHLLLRDQHYAQFWLGLAGGFLVPLLHGVILSMGSSEPAFGWSSARQWAILGLLNGAACPVIFILFDRLRATFEYQPADPGLYRLNREMKRGRT